MLKSRCGLPLAVVLSVLFLAGCAGFSRDGGFAPVAAEVQRRTGAEPVWPRDPPARQHAEARRAGLLAQPLGIGDAVQLALLGNHRLQADFAVLQVAEAALVQSGRLPNPRIDVLRASRGGQYDIEETVSFNVLALLTQPYAHRVEAQRFAAAQQAAVAAVQSLALDTRAAWIDAVAADASLQQARDVQEAASLSATLAERMRRAGNWTVSDQAHEQQFLLEATRMLREAEAQQVASRQHLRVLLGLDDAQADALRLEAHLPALPDDLAPLPDVEQVILTQRLDLQQQRLELDALARQLKLTRATRFVNVLDAGATRIRQGGTDAPYEPGFRLAFEIPLFDGGQPRLRRAEALYAQGANRYAQAALEARAQVRLAYADVAARFAVARQEADVALPLRRQVVAENIRRYNAAQLSVFDLLADARAQSAAVLSCIETQRQFWRARSRLDAAVLGSGTREPT